MFKEIVRCLNLPTIAMAVATALGGWACALLTGNFEVLAAILCLIFAILFLMAANMAACYFDQRYRQESDLNTYVMQPEMSKLPPAFFLRELTVGFGCCAGLVGIGIVAFGGWWSFAVGLVMTATIYMMNASPSLTFRKVWGLVIAFVFFGPVGAGSTYLVQKVHVSGWPSCTIEYRPILWIGLTLGFYAIGALLTYNYLSYDYDVQHKVGNFSAKHGRGLIKWCFLVNALAIYACPEILFWRCPYIKVFSWEAIGPTILFLFNLYIFLKLKKDAPQKELILLQRLSMYNMLIFAVYILVFFWIISIPSIDPRHYFSNVAMLTAL